MDWAKGKILGYTVDPEAKALYVRLSDKPYGFGEDLDHERRIDFSLDRTPIGLEITCIDTGVELNDLPNRDELAELLSYLKIKVYA
jgi:Protein of unknown function (DUF2283)